MKGVSYITQEGMKTTAKGARGEARKPLQKPLEGRHLAQAIDPLTGQLNGESRCRGNLTLCDKLMTGVQSTIQFPWPSFANPMKELWLSVLLLKKY